ncbi:phosphotyrosine phosphatase BceD [Paraburkholderia sp. PGU19]|uniref:arsenate reductase/protein-tyrosine-phosphatase family protein n=1 Tax=Paraburkholderia sp. PGU19 TaxID=2735434 RepID=UPI0015DAE651|nr:low molecular weight phosphotyrosine protein phosphatase [Paraburkholderia sp. PGU19]BCF99401.1 phosphotyrosine phosphatase BceD [Paraburkholderia sp. PGU19]
MFSNVLIVCYANICRSPAAEVVFKSLHPGVSCKPVTYHSAGVRAFEGMEMDAVMKDLLVAQGLSVAPHRSRRLNIGMVREADLILVAERNQIGQVEDLDRAARGKVFALGNWEGIDVVDPHGKSESSYRASLTLIERLAAGWIERIC